MAFLDSREFFALRGEPEKALTLPLGLASPLWGVFSGVALTGVAWWWATQWMREPLAKLVTDIADQTSQMLETTPTTTLARPAEKLVAPMVETVEAVAEPVVEAVEAVTTPVVEAVPEPVAKTVMEADLPEHVVGGEAAPIPPAAAVAEPVEAPVEAAPEVTEAVPSPAPKPSKPRAPSPPRSIA